MIMGVWDKTVWSEENTRGVPQRYRLLYTMVLPIKYAMIGLYGLSSIGAAIPSIDLVFGVIYGDIWSVALTLAGFGAMLGVIFYARLVWLEVVSVVLFCTLMLLYVGSIFIAWMMGVELFRMLSLLIVLILLPVPSWRVLDIVRELRPPRNVS